MNFKRMLTGVAMMTAVSAFAQSATYWVDDDVGDDTYSGTSATVTGEKTPGGVTIGPKHSLKAGMALASSGDVVKVLPGAYRDEVDSNNARVSVKDGVKLVSTGGRDVTFIYGQPSPTPDAGNAQGIGSNAVRCVYLEGTGAIFGFTLTDGHTINVDNATGYGGGVYAIGVGTVVDCVISNCCAVRGGGASGSSIRLVGSILDGCNTYPKYGRGLYQGTAWSCLFRNMDSLAAYNCKAYNCTIDGPATGTSANPYNMRCWDSVLYSDGGYVQATNCCLSGVWSSLSDWSDPNNQKGLTRATQLATDAAYMPVKGKHVGIDCGNWDCYTNSFPAIAADYLYKDVYGKRRVVNGTMDIGAVECDYLQAFTDALMNGRRYFAVTNFTDNVYEKTEGSQVALPVGEVLLGAWTIPAQDTLAETYSLTAELSGNAVLKVYADGVLKLTLTESGPASYTHIGSHGVRLVCEGTDGEAVLSVFFTTAHKPYYVAPAPKGNDANDGLTADTPKETLAAIAAIATEPGSIIHAARGVYDKGLSGPVGTAVTTNRVIVAEGVGLQGDEGAAVTFIEGVQNVGGYAYASNVVRCCYLKAGAWIRGFTLRGGGAAMLPQGYGECGGGLLGATEKDADSLTWAAAAAIECVFTNNVACRGNSTSDADLIRCVVYGTGNAAAGFGDSYNVGCLVDSAFANVAHAYTLDPVVNCTFDDGQVWASGKSDWCKSGKNMVFNSIIENTSSNKKFCNCTIKAQCLSTPTTSEADADCRFNVTVALDGNYRPVAADTNAVERGRNDYYDTYFPSRWVQFKNGKDLAGGARRIGSTIDIGAGEFSWAATPYGGLVVTVTEGAAPGTWDMTVSREDVAGNQTTGFTFRGETIRFADHPIGWSWTKTVTGAYPTAADLVPVTGGDIYVNPVAGDDGNAGWHPDLAFKTINRAMGGIAVGGTIHCAAGTYAVTNGNFHWDGYVTNVVYFTTDYVTLVADEGPDATIIEGVLSEGTEAVRGVSMAAALHSVVRGFTIRNCATEKRTQDSGNYYGGGVFCGTAVDCVISNCWSGIRGGAAANADLVRCFIGLGCRSPRTGYGTGGHAVNGYGSVFQMETYTAGGTFVNCVYLDCAPGNSVLNNRNNVYNTFIAANSSGRCNYHNCVLTGAITRTSPQGEAYTDVDVVGNVEHANAADYAYDPVTFRPLAGSKLIDGGSNETFVAKFPANFQAGWLAEDFAGGQRVYNARVDIGVGEYDARPDFAQRLARRRLAVDTATPTVALGETDGLTMKGGDVLELRWQIVAEGVCSFRVAGADTCVATVTVDGVVVTPDANGVYAFGGTVGEHAVSVTCAGTGSATVDSFTCPRLGSVILVR